MRKNLPALFAQQYAVAQQYRDYAQRSEGKHLLCPEYVVYVVVPVNFDKVYGETLHRRQECRRKARDEDGRADNYDDSGSFFHAVISLYKDKDSTLPGQMLSPPCRMFFSGKNRHIFRFF